MPFVVQWKGRLAPDSVYVRPEIQLDAEPTAPAAAGIALRPEWKLDGGDLAQPLMAGCEESAQQPAIL